MKNEIIILLATYNGSKYLKEQLDSICSQSYKNFEIIARDDGSSDNTLDILKSYDVKTLETKQNLGAKGSFSVLLEYVVNNSDAEYFMFCDQDDIWEKDKVENTFAKMKLMEKQYSKTPILIHTDLKVVDEELNTLSNSMWEYENINPKLNTLNRLLMQNTITGCTVLINRKLAELALPVASEAIMHDWWLGLVASSFGKIGFLNESTIKYRQHSSNDTGAKSYGIKYILNKLKNFNEISIEKNILQAKAFLENYREQIDSETLEMLEEFSSMNERMFLEKRKILWKYKLLKQGFVRNIGLFVTI